MMSPEAASHRLKLTVIALLVLLAHAAAIFLLPGLASRLPFSALRDTPRAGSVLVAVPVLGVPATPARRVPPAPATRALSAGVHAGPVAGPKPAPLLSPSRNAALPQSETATAAPPETAASSEASNAPALSSAAGSSSATTILDADSMRRAARASGRQPSISDLAARDLRASAGPAAQSRMAAGMEDAARGDCAKGDFKGGGMGVLSLPFLAAAALRGECAR